MPAAHANTEEPSAGAGTRTRERPEVNTEGANPAEGMHAFERERGIFPLPAELEAVLEDHILEGQVLDPPSDYTA